MVPNENIEEYPIVIDTEKVGEDIRKITDEISAGVIGQSRAISHILRIFASEEVCLRDPNRPIGVMILAGPSGVGKTLTAKLTARAFLGASNSSDYPLTYIQCSNLHLEHQTASLIGSPPGYVGYGDLPLLHWINLDKHHFFIKIEKEINDCKSPERQNILKRNLQEAKQIIDICQREDHLSPQAALKHSLRSVFNVYMPLKSLILFDEIEKAHPNVWNLLLGILEDGQLQLATGETTNFRNSFIILTTNTGSREIKGLMDGGIGYRLPRKEETAEHEKLDQAIYEETKKALQRVFPPEFIGRIGKEIVVFRTLTHDDYSKILEIFLNDVQLQLGQKKGNSPHVLIKYTSTFREFLIKNGTSQEYGARILRDMVKKYVIDTVSFAFSSKELIAGDEILFDLDDAKPIIRRKSRPQQALAIIEQSTV